MPYTIGIINDIHCGAKTALRKDPQNAVQEKLLDKWENEIIDWLKGCDLLVINGDMNDGQDPKGRNLQNDDVPWQIEEAESLILDLEPSKVRMTFGSSYHVGDTVAYERFLCGYLQRRGVDCEIDSVQDLSVGWWRGLFRHKVSRSIIPHGRHTGATRSAVWGMLKEGIKARESGTYEVPPHFYCFAHTHYYAESATSLGRVLINPGWKAESAKGADDQFGAKNFDDVINIGASKVEINADKEGEWMVYPKYWTAEVQSKTEEVL